MYLESIGYLAMGLALLYGGLALVASLLGIKADPRQPDRRRPVTVLKPLCGDEPGLYEHLQSFCEQDHDCFQIVFGTNSADDPALEVVERLRADYPHVDIAVSPSCPTLGCNLKISNLTRMLTYAHYDTLVIADSDIRVCRDYLARVIAPLADRDTGMVSCLYRSLDARDLWSRLAAMFIEDWFFTSVLVSRLLGNKLATFGATIALERQTLSRIGGFEAINNHLADDYIIGLRVKQLGLATVLSDYVVQTSTHEPTLAAMLSHEKRWMQTIRSAQPIGYTFTFITFTLPLGLLALLLGAEQTILPSLFLVIVAMRCATRLTRPWRGLRQTCFDIALIPVRDALTAFVWAWGLFGRRIIWRNQQFALGRNGYLKPITFEDKS